MNIKNVFYTLLALGLMAAAPAAMAQDTNAPAPAKKAAKGKKEATKEPSVVGKALQEMTFLTDKKPNPDAKYYIYLQSASWCGPCNAEMPHVVEAHEKYKEEGLVEIVLASWDNDPGSAKAFLNKYKGKFPAVMRKDAKRIPHFKEAQGIPWAMIIDANGEVKEDGNAGIVLPKLDQYAQQAKAEQENDAGDN